MWVLESSGDDLKGKRLWLRPGKRICFGRTRNDQIGEHIILCHKTISRQHLTVEVGQSNVDDCCDIRARSKVVVQDFDTKIGTILNEEQIRGRRVELKKEKNILTLGRYEQSYGINWIPVTLTFSFTTKEHKANPYPKLYLEFGPLDIKILSDYQHEHTTHVVAKKRNTSKGLQALIDGKYIVHNDSFVNALLISTSPVDGNCAPLEVDFDKNFPNPIRFLPPKGDEPNYRDDKLFYPNKLRQNIFSGYIFVIYEERQYENLLSPITAGSGKAILKVVRPNEITAEDFVKFCGNIVSDLRMVNASDPLETKIVIVVRYNPATGLESEWYSEFCKNVALQLNHQLVEQNEFLDAILANDASILKRPLNSKEFERIDFPASQKTSSPVIPLSVRKDTQPSPLRRTRTRRTPRPKFTGFDDDFTEPFKTAPLNTQNSDPSGHKSPSPKIESCQSQGLFVSQDPNYASDPLETHCQTIFDPGTVPKQEISKDDMATVEIEPKDNLTNQKWPNYKETNYLGAPSPSLNLHPKCENNHAVPGSAKLLPFMSASRKKRKDSVMDVEDILLQKLEKSKVDAEKKAGLDSLNEYLNEIDFAEVRNKILVEDIKPRSPRRNHKLEGTGGGSRWNDLWNGRKNFKKFRRPGSGARVFEKVIVQLKEVKKKNNEIFEDYWGTDVGERTSTNSKIKERTLDEVTLNERSLEIYSNLTGTTNTSPVLEESSENCSTIQSPIKSKLSSLKSNLQYQKETFTMRQPLISMYMSRDDQSSSYSGLKRAAHSDSCQSAHTKKPRLMPIDSRELSGDESEDDLRFRFKRN